MKISRPRQAITDYNTAVEQAQQIVNLTDKPAVIIGNKRMTEYEAMPLANFRPEPRGSRKIDAVIFPRR